MAIDLSCLQHYPPELQQGVRRLAEQGSLGDYLAQRYPERHAVQNDKALYAYVNAIRQESLRNAPLLDKVQYDARLGELHHALGLNTAVSRVQGGRLKAKKEIRVATLFREAPAAFLRMIAVHELAHLKERSHDKAFYQLCTHMEPAYHQLEFDFRAWLVWRSINRTNRTIANEERKTT
jgi:UTP pyrophosphatase